MSSFYYLMSSFTPEPPKVGSLDKPLGEHLTLLNGFSIADRYKAGFIANLARLALWMPPFTINPTVQAHYGENGEYEVWKVEEPTGSLFSLHNSLCEMVKSSGGFIANPFHGENFSPHVSDWVNPRPVFVPHFVLVNHQNGFGVDVSVDATFLLRGERVV